MRIRRSAARLLGSTYSAPPASSPMFLPPSPPLRSGAAGDFPSSASECKEICKLSRSPWDLINDLPVSDPQVIDDLLDIYHVDLNSRTCWLFPRSMPTMPVKKKKMKQAMDVSSKDKAQVQTPNKTVAKKEKMPKKIVKKMKKDNMEGEARMNAKVKNEEGEEGAPQDFMCKKNDGKGWYCKQRVSRPNTLCERHVRKKVSYLNPKFASPIVEEKVVVMALAVGSKACRSSKTRKKKPANHFNTIEDFYYYDGFGPLLSKKYCRSTTHGSTPLAPKQEEVELELPKVESPLNQAKVVAGDGTSYGVATQDGVPTFDKGSGDDDYDPDSSSRNINLKRKKNPWKRWRKPVKARSLKSL